MKKCNRCGTIVQVFKNKTEIITIENFKSLSKTYIGHYKYIGLCPNCGLVLEGYEEIELSEQNIIKMVDEATKLV